MHAQSLQSYLSLCNTMDCSPPVSSIHGILQARILQWVATPSSKGSSQTRDPIPVSCTSGRYFTHWARWEAHSHPAVILKNSGFSNKTCYNLSSIPWFSLFSQVQMASAVYLNPVSIFKYFTREHFLAKLILVLYPYPCTYALILSKRVLWKTLLNPNDLLVYSLEIKKLVFPH